VADSELLPHAGRERLRRKLAEVAESWIAARLPALFRLAAAPLAGAARGLAHQLAEGLGSMPVDEGLVRSLSREDRQALARLDVRVGRHGLYLPPLLKPRAQELRALLWSVHAGRPRPALPGIRPAVTVAEAVPAEFYEAVGFAVLGEVAVRRDVLERVAALVRHAARQPPFQPGPDLHSALGLGVEGTAKVLAGLGYRRAADGFRPPKPPRHGPKRPDKPSDSPFAVLKGR
jgi:ATP-dependent RNA helicase SUPV3L1/SUV3